MRIRIFAITYLITIINCQNVRFPAHHQVFSPVFNGYKYSVGSNGETSTYEYTAPRMESADTKAFRGASEVTSEIYFSRGGNLKPKAVFPIAIASRGVLPEVVKAPLVPGRIGNTIVSGHSVFYHSV